MSNKCAICLKSLKWFHKKKIYYHCKHKLHVSCYNEYINNSYMGYYNFCPLCRAFTIGKYFNGYIVDNDACIIRNKNFWREWLDHIDMHKKLCIKLFNYLFTSKLYNKKLENCVNLKHILVVNVGCSINSQFLHITCSNCSINCKFLHITSSNCSISYKFITY